MTDMARSKKKSRELCFGAVLTALGCALRIIQLTGAYFGAGFVSHKALYIAMLCLLCGGFAVLAYEKKGKASLLAMVASAASLLSTVMGNMSSGNDALRIFSAAFLVATFAAAGLHAVAASNGKKLKSALGFATVALAILCGAMAAGLSLAPVATLAILIAAYVFTAAAVLV